MTLDEQLFGDLFQGSSWAAWRACTAALFGEPMTAADLEVYRACTGRDRPPDGPVRRITVIGGRRSGKTRTAARWAVRLATRDYRPMLAPGEIATCR
jgi:phage terminase large subunit-like protein